ncbi:hypothetical protein [Roseateles puraquae]|uniref:hypothetical protein n=1 Tax=Roseateles puraquae TaxID=431059 RepID=UPI0031D30CAB
MKSMNISRRLPSLQAFLARRPSRERHDPSLDTCMPDDAELADLQRLAQSLRQPRSSVHPRPLSRQDIELALDAGTRRYFPPRGETEVLERH